MTMTASPRPSNVSPCRSCPSAPELSQKRRRCRPDASRFVCSRARGLMQLMPRTDDLVGVNASCDPAQNMDGGSHYLSDLLKKYGNDITLALAAYNAGPDSVDKYGRRVPPYLEAMKYVQRIAKTYAKLKADALNPATGLSLPQD